MSGDATWELLGDRATLLCGSLRATLDVRRPAQGLHDLSLDGRRLDGCQLLGVSIDTCSPDTVADCYVRGGDLIVRYAQTADRPFAVGVYWRAGFVPLATQPHPCVDLVVSVETSFLDSRPELEARTSLAIPAADGRLSPSPSGCLGRFPRFALSYAEMVHPDDALALVPASTPLGVSFTTRLFGQPLEKGVILRSRLRGVFVRLDGDQAMAADALARFAALPPPLTA